jgi:acyl carrier protein
VSPADIRAVLKDELARIAPDVDFETIDPNADLRDAADIDSMDFLNWVTALHARLGVEIPEADNPKLITVAGAIAYLAERLQVGDA